MININELEEGDIIVHTSLKTKKKFYTIISSIDQGKEIFSFIETGCKNILYTEGIDFMEVLLNLRGYKTSLLKKYEQHS